MSQAFSGVEPSAILPGIREKASQIDSPLPSSPAAPSNWAALVAVPNIKSLGNLIFSIGILSSFIKNSLSSPPSSHGIGAILPYYL